jgi:hypothetical protein
VIAERVHVCAACGSEFEPRRRDARTCSDRCRQRAHRRGDRATIEDAALQRRADAARRLLARERSLDAELILSYVIWPTARLERAAA